MRMKKFGLMTKIRSKSEKKADRTEKVPTRKTFLPRTRSRRPRAKAPSLPGRKTSGSTKPRPKGAPGYRRGAGRHRVPHRTPPPKPRLSRSEGSLSVPSDTTFAASADRRTGCWSLRSPEATLSANGRRRSSTSTAASPPKRKGGPEKISGPPIGSSSAGHRSETTDATISCRSSCIRRSLRRPVLLRCGATGCIWPYGRNGSSNRS